MKILPFLFFLTLSPLFATSLPKDGFLEPETPFLRSALVFTQDGNKHLIRRALLMPLNFENRWACFDPDTLTWPVVWQAPEGKAPFTYDSMAAVSYPDAKAKAKRAPRLQGTILTANPSKKSSPGPLDQKIGKWIGITLSGDSPILHYRLNGKTISESASSSADQILIRKPAADLQAATPIFPKTFSVKNPAPKNDGPFTIQNIAFPKSARAIRATDLAFLSDGTALLSTLDGDIWRIDHIEKERATWTRIATGLFEPMAIEVSPEDKIYVLGRDQITELVDTNNDHHIDLFRNASNNFLQTIHTRDYATSLALGPDGYFYIAKGGLFEKKPDPENEFSLHRGTLLRISPDGSTSQVLADGLRLPYVGYRSDGSVFASDQQGNFVPSTPIYQLPAASKPPTYGFPATQHRSSPSISAPLLYYPYQHSRSGAAFIELPKSPALPDLSPGFHQVSWNGALFALLTPEKGRPFSYRWPLQLDFPSLNAAVHPKSKKLYAVGLGISGYKPTTPNLTGLASISQHQSIPTPALLDLSGDTITIRFHRPLSQNETVIPANPTLRLFDVQRTRKYGSGHFLANGEPGEHHLQPSNYSLSPDRQTLTLKFPTLFRADILDLQLTVTSDSTIAPLHLYTRPHHLPKATPSDLAKLTRKETPLKPGNPKKGAIHFTQYACAGCHSLKNEKLVGPALNQIATRLNKAQLTESILEPEKTIAQGFPPAMPSFAGVIPAQELEDLLTYLLTLK